MAGSRASIVVGILAIAGGITWFALRDSGRGSRPAQGSGALTPRGSGSGSGKAAIFAPEGPQLAGSGNAFDPPRPALLDAQVIDAPSHRDVFTAQTRDPAWAAKIEGELEAQMRRLKLTAVQGVECRADQCELTITGTIHAVETTIAALESPEGLSTSAKSLLLGGPEHRDDQLTLRVYALFER